jgi:hypothetical protein
MMKQEAHTRACELAAQIERLLGQLKETLDQLTPEEPEHHPSSHRKSLEARQKGGAR